jgi:predicted nucleic acid-binding protein
MAAPTTYLLDTNILVLLIRGKAAGKGVAANFGLSGNLNRGIISVVTVGEMNALVRKWGWGQAKLDVLEKLLGQVVQVDIDHPDILTTYGDLDFVSHGVGRKMGKNDLWIAATAKVCGLPLLTTDTDFDHLCPTEITRIRIDGNTGAALP